VMGAAARNLLSDNSRSQEGGEGQEIQDGQDVQDILH
jgi:hypothetical protein